MHPTQQTSGSVWAKIVFFTSILLCLFHLLSPPLALLTGIIIAQTTRHPYPHLNHKATHLLLQISVVGLGFGMNALTAVQAGRSGFLFTAGSIISVLLLGYVSGRLLKINRKSSVLISVGTAICGGSAIASVSPVIRAEEEQVSLALGTIFLLNALALFIFPLLGHWFGLSPQQFGLWCAIAIQDTSSVVGAAARFGPEALSIATTIKLARALWIIPVSLISAGIFRNKHTRIKIPYFIGLFVLAILLHTYIPAIQPISPYILQIAHSGLTLTLLLIGTGLSRKNFSTIGIRPVLQGVLLWVFISVASLWMILYT